MTESEWDVQPRQEVGQNLASTSAHIEVLKEHFGVQRGGSDFSARTRQAQDSAAGRPEKQRPRAVPH